MSHSYGHCMCCNETWQEQTLTDTENMDGQEIALCPHCLRHHQAWAIVAMALKEQIRQLEAQLDMARKLRE